MSCVHLLFILLKVLIHDPYTWPMIEELGFAVSPGTEAFVSAHEVKVLDVQLLQIITCSNALHIRNTVKQETGERN